MAKQLPTSESACPGIPVANFELVEATQRDEDMRETLEKDNLTSVKPKFLPTSPFGTPDSQATDAEPHCKYTKNFLKNLEPGLRDVIHGNWVLPSPSSSLKGFKAGLQVIVTRQGEKKVDIQMILTDNCSDDSVHNNRTTSFAAASSTVALDRRLIAFITTWSKLLQTDSESCKTRNCKRWNARWENCSEKAGYSQSKLADDIRVEKTFARAVAFNEQAVESK
ncbi:hypothetical protein F5887DRAFT_1206305 [Amanita rubescens]|nr:hypothetical protein F5887DRAFT_1206305 [Amanita rubescens]